ncbi:MAG TPA: bifunctional UDP-3-O-[3-hydroxymyristoyl] N-acetylglucosamine deacetylase/3-hydroxyacyl-ACP dehydratase [Candidatus Kapabacteria bacterium]|nr:bifunctional UDP-3-O-[3-hydroxymyristoyl] N-acetylglucosamine deacetylase/3-hydroxyacyl-ACP dehydratase [Candidatus Kapabacteria bacterium]
MIQNQRTLRERVSFSGTGLHTGANTTITFCPAPENYGLRFVRTDIEGSPEIPALVDYVVDITRGTVLEMDKVRVHTVEHVLAALVGTLVDNCRIELDGVEPPVGDGSAKPYVDAILKAGFEEQSVRRNYLAIDQTIHYQDEKHGVDIVALPLENDFRVTVMIDYHNPALGTQHTGLFNLENEFVKEYSSARTFCFLSEIEMLIEKGLIRGGGLDNAIVIVDEDLSQSELKKLVGKLGIQDSVMLGENGILNNRKLRFKNEPARHKLLDLLGDFALIGVPLHAQVLAARPGHKSNVEFARMVRKMYKQKQLTKKYGSGGAAGTVFDCNAILKIMPHRYPFLLVDRIIEYDHEAGKIVGIKNVTINEPHFMGHFPSQPIMPGVLIVEAMAQTGGMLMLHRLDNPDNQLVFFLAINNAKFRKPVVPGDQLVMEVSLVNKRSKAFTLAAKAFVDGTVVAEAELMAAIIDKDQAKQ